MSAPAQSTKAPGHKTELQRIQSIEESVITCIDLAATATEQLSSIGNVDKAAVVSACEAYVENIKKAQTLVQEVLTHSATAKSFEASSYYAQARAQIAVEKVHAVAGHLSDMQKVLQAQAAAVSERAATVPMDIDGHPEAAADGNTAHAPNLTGAL